MTHRRRSVLFTPGTKPDRIRKALHEPLADVVVADLEDGVAPRDKDEARTAVGDLLADIGPGEAAAERAVRINTWPGPPADDDLDAVLPSRPDLIVVPKAEDPRAVRSLDERLEAAGLGATETGLLLILETAAGVLAARELAAAAPRVRAIALGAEDLAANVGLRRTPDNAEVAVPRGLLPLAAAAAGVQAIDMITVDFQDLDRCGAEAVEARRLGYAGKMCIHPGQVAVVNAAFRPTEDEVSWAERVVAAAEAGGVGEGGVAVVDGKMIDVPLVEQARRILRDAA